MKALPVIKLIPALALFGFLGIGSSVATAGTVSLGDQCTPESYTVSPSGTNDLGFHCSGFSDWSVFLVQGTTIDAELWSPATDEVFFSEDPTADSLIGTTYAGQGQGAYDDTGDVTITVQTDDGPWNAEIQSDATPEPASGFLIMAALVVAFAMRKWIAPRMNTSF